ncbi:MAG TPA: beta-L-arabinofuranosidase domain-containing protein [Abditibacteriaceae bacterium]|jgi:hypothetical protein
MKHLLFGTTILLSSVVSAASPEVVKPKIVSQAQPFALGEVQLLDSPFTAAQARNAKYLLDLEPDRLLHRFRLYAGLQPKGALYGGWEAQGISGHILGHYLTALAQEYAATRDEKWKQRVAYIVTELALCQAQYKDGVLKNYVGAIPDAERIFREVSQGNIRSAGFDLNGGWVPWYTQHKIYAGLLDAYVLTGNEQAKTVVSKFGDWAIEVTKNLNDEQWQRMLACEHGGMNESLAQLYAITGETKYLDLAKKFYHRAILDPLAAGRDELAGKHANTQVPKAIGTARLYELTGEEEFGTVSRFFWERLINHHSYAMGGNSIGEHLGPPDKLNDRLGPSTAETCNTYNMLKLTRHLFSWQPEGRYADFYERALYNHILASQDPKTGMMCYYVSLLPGHFKTYSNPFDSFWCCVGSGIENHNKYSDSIYFQGGNNLWVNLFIPSQLNWKDKGLTLRQETAYPDNGKVQLTFGGQSQNLALRLRIPQWLSHTPTVEVNGKKQPFQTENGYALLTRTWKAGDKITYWLPLQLRQEAMPDNPKRIALFYGPVTLSGTLGTQGLDDKRVYGNSVGDIGGDLPQVPVLITSGKPLESWLKPVAGEALNFKTSGIGKPQDIHFEPFYNAHHERFSIYFDVFTKEEWEAREAAYRAEEQRKKDLEARSVDFFATGEMQAERDHNLQGERTFAGDFNNRKWRDARDGGWFAFDMKKPATPSELVLTFWGSDVGNRVFDVLINGKVAGTVRLNNNKPNEFFDMAFPLPDGGEKVTVKLQAHPGAMAGGLFGARVVKK